MSTSEVMEFPGDPFCPRRSLGADEWDMELFIARKSVPVTVPNPAGVDWWPTGAELSYLHQFALATAY